jgi:hypothetical protein
MLRDDANTRGVKSEGTAADERIVRLVPVKSRHFTLERE